MFQLELRIPPLVLVAVFAVGIALVTAYAPLVVVPFPGHRYASAAMLMAGLLLALIGVLQFLGHSSHSVTERYAHLSSKSLMDAANTASAMIKGASAAATTAVEQEVKAAA